MSRVDDRIRTELRRMSVPIDGRRAFDRVDRRRRRLRILRRARFVAVAAAVAAAAVAAGLGLRAVLEASGGPRPGITPSPTPLPAPGVEPVTLCGASTAIADVDGDDADDRIAVGVPRPEGTMTCDDLRLEGYVARIELAAGTDRAVTLEQELPDCEFRGQCWVLATPDLNDDGRAEVAIELISGASTANFSLYRFHPESATGPLRRLEVVPPGDPFDEQFGIVPGTATFAWYGSVTHQHWITCGTEPEDRGVFAIVTALRDPDNPDLQRVHTTSLSVVGDALAVTGTEEETVPDGSLGSPPDLCGSPLNPAPEPGDEVTL